MIYDINEIKRRITPVLKKYDVKAAFLFGSYARGTATNSSDIDIRVDTTGSSKLLGIFAESGLLIDLENALEKKVDMITIGIGAGAGCDGQVLVWQDMTGINQQFTPKFVKHFGEIGEALKDAFRAYDAEVKAGTFPAAEHSFVKSDCSDEFLEGLREKY